MRRLARAVISIGMLLLAWVLLEASHRFSSGCGLRVGLLTAYGCAQMLLMTLLFGRLYARHEMTRSQWDIGTLLIFTVMVALLLGMGRLVPLTREDPATRSQMDAIAVVICFFCLVPLLNLAEALLCALAGLRKHTASHSRSQK